MILFRNRLCNRVLWRKIMSRLLSLFSEFLKSHMYMIQPFVSLLSTFIFLTIMFMLSMRPS